MDALYQILTFVFGGTSVVGTILSVIWWKQTKRLKEAEVKQKEAEADKTQADADDAEVTRLLAQVDHQQKTIENLLTLNSNLTERLSKLNATVDKHINRNRELSDRLYQSETEQNRLNERIIALTKECNNERSMKEHYKMWHCRKSGCEDRIPPNEKLKGLKYEPPMRTVK
jgi:predicted RNase H-like nuclease (RuvC/YqgF family)